jgi:hypothetical protein
MNSRNQFGTVVGAIFVWAASSAAVLGQNGPADDRSATGDEEDSRPAFSATITDQPQGAGCCDLGCEPSCGCPRWTATADFIILDRIGSGNATLVERVPGNLPPTTPGTEALNSSDLQQGFAGGPRLDLIRHGDSGYDLELAYFQIDGWHSDQTIVPADPQNWRWLTMSCPGGFLQANEGRGQGMAWQYATKLYDAELNVRWNPWCRVTMLAGFRWINLGENLQGALEPPTVWWEPPFWNTTTTNNLYGFQIGTDWKIWERGRFSIDGLVKAGICDNDAEENTGVSTMKIVRPSSASTNHAACVGETGLQCKYQVTQGLLLKGGYEAIWLEGVALAPGQIQETYMPTPTTAQALGVNCNSGVFYHGATVGLEYSF